MIKIRKMSSLSNTIKSQQQDFVEGLRQVERRREEMENEEALQNYHVLQERCICFSCISIIIMTLYWYSILQQIN